MSHNLLPSEGYVRLSQIIGNRAEGIPPIVPVSRSTWWEGVRTGRYPKPVRTLGPRITCWRASDIRALISGTGETVQP